MSIRGEVEVQLQKQCCSLHMAASPSVEQHISRCTCHKPVYVFHYVRNLFSYVFSNAQMYLFFTFIFFIIEMELASRADHRPLRWFGHVERMDEDRIPRKVLMAEVSGGRVRGRPSEVPLDGWCEGGLGQQKNDGGGCSPMRERLEWRALVHM